MDAVVTGESNFAASRSRWFLRGTAIGVLLMAAANALSYFFRSASWDSLTKPVQSTSLSDEWIGFPFVVWQAGNSYGGMFVDYPMLGMNALIAVAVGAVIGAIAVYYSQPLNEMIATFAAGPTGTTHHPFQFSLLGLMVSTAIVAFITMLAKNFASRPETLIAIYMLGPATLVAVAMLPRRLSWQKRVAIIIPITLCLIAIAIVVGLTLGMEFDKVLMGIFLCWVPQSALAAIALTAWLLVDHFREVSKEAVCHE